MDGNNYSEQKVNKKTSCSGTEGMRHAVQEEQKVNTS